MGSNWYEEHRQEIIERSRLWKENNRDRYNELTRLRRKGRKAERALEARKYRAKYPDKVKKASKRLYDADPEKYRARRRAYYHRNREKELEAIRKYGKANRKRIIAQRRSREKSDPVVAMVERLRRRLVKAVARWRTCKSASTLELIGCTPIQLHNHIESLFLPGMSWTNRNLWHVDHKRPLASFDLRDPAQQREAFHYTNLQPLWAVDNQSKGCRL